ncbi:MAG: hypothetical protein AB7G23_03490 [Vicinamibacterales bacterium]
MPFLRVIRDRHGYDTTYLMRSPREAVRSRTGILYVFRSPSGVRGGREPLSPDVRRQLEVAHPDIAFNWSAILDGRQLVEPAPDLRRPRRRRSPDAVVEPSAPARSQRPARVEPRRGPDSGPDTGTGSGTGSGEGHDEQGQGEASRPVAMPPAVQGTTPDEQVAFLALWYPRVRDRVTARATDPERRASLLDLAERLNPAAWTDADQMAAGLATATDAFERLARVLTRRRRRSRRPTRPPGGGGEASIESGGTGTQPEDELPETGADEPEEPGHQPAPQAGSPAAVDSLAVGSALERVPASPALMDQDTD